MTSTLSSPPATQPTAERGIFTEQTELWRRQTLGYFVLFTHSGVSDSLEPHGLQPTRLLCPWDFPDKNTGVGCHLLLQGIFLTQGSNPTLLHLLHWQADSLPLSHLGSPLFIYLVKAKFFEKWRWVELKPQAVELSLTFATLKSLSISICFNVAKIQCHQFF